MRKPSEAHIFRETEVKKYGMAEAEADLRAAIDADDAEAITRLGKVVDGLDVHPAPVSLHAAALWYVSVGLRVFPLSPGSKLPHKRCQACKDGECPGPEACGHELCHGLKDATSDPALVNKWWSEVPQRNVAIATGHLVDVIDIDGQPGVITWARMYDELPPIIGRVSTPRPGGNHLYTPAVSGRGNKAGIFPGIDYRGEGGYAVVPPSVIAPGGKDHPGTYEWIKPLDLASVREVA